MGRIGQFVKEARRRRVLPNVALYIVASWVAIQVADLAIEAGLIRWALRDVFAAAFLGFPIALVAGWYYDITRKGLVRTPPAGADPSVDSSLHVGDYLLFVSLAVVWAVSIVLVHTPPAEEHSIAILPFENPGHDPDNAIFGFGLRVDLQTQLQNLHDLRIIARESSDQIDDDMSLPEIGLKLGAAYIMRGSVERVLNRVRVNVVLIDAKKEEQTWAGSYDRELTASNWFDIRNEISRVITDRLRTELSESEKDRLNVLPTENLDALQAYFRGKQRMAKRTTAALAEAIDHFRSAVEIDPAFALAHVGLADSHYLNMLYSGLDEDAELLKMETAVTRALELNDQLGEAHATMAVLYRMQGRDADAEEAFTRALSLNPNYATARQWYGSTLVSLGRTEEGLAQKRKAQELDPLSAIVNLSLGMTLATLGRFDEALAQYEAVIGIDPAFPGPYERIAELYHTVFGQLDQAVTWQTKGVALEPGEPMGPIFLGFMYLDLLDPDKAEEWFLRSASLAPPGFPVSGAAMEPVYLQRGDDSRALDIARKSFEMFGGHAIQTLAHLRNHDLETGRYAEARDRYGRAFPELLGEDEPVIDGDNFEPAIDLALVLIKTGEQDRADLLLARSLAHLQTTPRLGPSGYGIADVLIYALQGKTEAALAKLRQAIDQGWRESWWFYLEHDPNLDSLREEPEFQAMLEEVRADMRKQLAHVRAMEAAGELEPIPDG
jgi:TolB-like protein/Tfp pilus assembly protein PilF